jgi:pimeloyl-ACP methyl ester carboxylesterase
MNINTAKLFMFVACILTMSVSALSAAEKATPVGPEGMAVYTPPSPLPEGKHGDLIWASEIKTDVPGARAWKILYHSTDIHDNKMPVSGMVIAPIGKAPAKGRPVVSWAHGTSGIPNSCAPSLVDNPARDANFYFLSNGSGAYDFGIPSLTQMIKEGYVVTATDYNGLGAPGVHQYLIGPSAARNALDAILAAGQIVEAGAGKDAVVMGWSQGGQAAIWAGQIANYVTTDTKVRGVVALAPVNALEQIKAFDSTVASGKALSPVSTAERMMAWYATTVVFPELKLSDVMTPFGIEFFTEASKYQCAHHMADSANYIQPFKGPVALAKPLNQDKWIKRYEQISLGNVPAQAPIAVYQGDEDAALAPVATDAYVKKACAGGAMVSYTRYAKTDHITLSGRAQKDFLGWIRDRFADKPAPSTCN